MVSCCPAILFLFFFLFFSYYPNKKIKKRRERSKSNFWKGVTKTNVCCYVVPETESTVVVLDQTGSRVFLQVVAAVLHVHNIIRPACLLPPLANQVASHPQLLRLQYVMKLGYCQCCFLQSDEQKRYKSADYELQKAQHGHKYVFPVTQVSCKRAIFRQVTCLKIAPLHET